MTCDKSGSSASDAQGDTVGKRAKSVTRSYKKRVKSRSAKMLKIADLRIPSTFCDVFIHDN